MSCALRAPLPLFCSSHLSFCSQNICCACSQHTSSSVLDVLSCSRYMFCFQDKREISDEHRCNRPRIRTILASWSPFFRCTQARKIHMLFFELVASDFVGTLPSGATSERAKTRRTALTRPGIAVCLTGLALVPGPDPPTTKANPCPPPRARPLGQPDRRDGQTLSGAWEGEGVRARVGGEDGFGGVGLGVGLGSRSRVQCCSDTRSRCWR